MLSIKSGFLNNDYSSTSLEAVLVKSRFNAVTKLGRQISARRLVYKSRRATGIKKVSTSQRTLVPFAVSALQLCTYNRTVTRLQTTMLKKGKRY